MSSHDESPPLDGPPRARRRLTVRLFGLVGAGALALAYFLWGTVDVPDHRVPVTGTVIRQDAAPPGLYHMIDVEYEVDGKRYTTRLPASRNTGPDVESFRPGDEVALLRSEEDPASTAPEGRPSAGRTSCRLRCSPSVCSCWALRSSPRSMWTSKTGAIGFAWTSGRYVKTGFGQNPREAA